MSPLCQNTVGRDFISQLPLQGWLLGSRRIPEWRPLAQRSSKLTPSPILKPDPWWWPWLIAHVVAPWILLEPVCGEGARSHYGRSLDLLGANCSFVVFFIWEALMTVCLTSGTHRCFDDVSKTHLCWQNASVNSHWLLDDIQTPKNCTPSPGSIWPCPLFQCPPLSSAMLPS